MKRKSLVAALGVVLVLLLAVGVTMAYLQGKTDTVINKFKDNEVDISINETTGNDYNILPGTEQDKDPTLTVTATTPAYAYVEITDNTQNLVTWELNDGWTALGTSYPNVYYRELPGQSSAYTFPLLKDNKVSYSSTLTTQDIRAGKAAADAANVEMNLEFTGYAMQKVPFNDPVTAWLAAAAQPVGTLQELKDALAAGKSVVLTADMDLDEQLVVNNPAVIDLNGHTISNTNDLRNQATNTLALISVQGADADLTLVGNGTVKAKADDCYAVDVRDGGKLTIDGGSYVGNVSAVYVDTGDLVINGGSFDIQQLADGTDAAQYRFLIDNLDANWTNNTNHVTINGGSFHNFDPDDNASEGAHTDYVPTGYGSVLTDEWYKVS